MMRIMLWVMGAVFCGSGVWAQALPSLDAAVEARAVAALEAGIAHAEAGDAELRRELAALRLEFDDLWEVVRKLVAEANQSGETGETGGGAFAPVVEPGLSREVSRPTAVGVDAVIRVAADRWFLVKVFSNETGRTQQVYQGVGPAEFGLASAGVHTVIVEPERGETVRFFVDRERVAEAERSGGEVRVGAGESLAAAFGRVEAGGTVLLESGGVWGERLPVPADGVAVGVYGDGARPIVGGFDLAGRTMRGVRIEGLAFVAGAGVNVEVFRGVGRMMDVEVADCTFFGGVRGVVVQGSRERPSVGVRFAWCEIGGQSNDVSPEPRGIGVYGRHVEGLVLEGNLIRDVGYLDPRRKYSQGAYLSDGTGGAVLRGNVFLRIGASAFQLRAGGVAEGNVLIRQAPHSWVGGGASRMVGNLVVLAEDLTGEEFNPRGGGLCVEAGGEGTVLADNLVFGKRGSNERYGGYKFEVPPGSVVVSGNLTDYEVAADAWGRPVAVSGIDRVAAVGGGELAALEAWAEGLVGRGRGVAWPGTGAVILGFREAVGRR